jgi:hypothetical protein
MGGPKRTFVGPWKLSGDSPVTTQKEIPVIRSYARVTNRRTALLVAALVFAVSAPLTLALMGFKEIIRSAEVFLPFVPFIILAILIVMNRSIRDKPSTVRLEGGGMRSAWDSRRFFVPKGKACFHPWLIPRLGITQGACVELWCGDRSFVIGARGVTSDDVSMEAPSMTALDCEVSREEFFQITRELFGELPERPASKTYRDLALVTSPYGITRGLKKLSPWLIALPAVCLPVAILGSLFDVLESQTGIFAMTALTVVLILCVPAFTIKKSMTPRGPTLVLRIIEWGFELRQPDGRILSSAPLSQVEASALHYRFHMPGGWTGEWIDSAVLKVSFSDATLYLSSANTRDAWSTTTKRCGPPQYMLGPDNWKILLSILAPKFTNNDLPQCRAQK